MSVIVTGLTEELLMKSLKFFVKYKELGYKIHNRMFDIHPLLGINDKNFKTNFSIFKTLYKNELGVPITVYKNKNNDLYPYPSKPLWISASGRFVGLDSRSVLSHDLYHWQYLLFDMEHYDFVDYAWQDLLGIDEETKTIIGRSMKICGNETQDNSEYNYKINTKNKVTQIKSTTGVANRYIESKIYYFLPNLNKIFLLSDEPNSIKDFILEKQNLYRDNEEFQSICNSLVVNFYDRYDITEFSNLKQIDFALTLYSFQIFLKNRELPF